CQQESDWHLTF
nr:immunoglobulin light chain junction region [Macaca mulatta]MOW64928.1 immunoglobulin light chain junction region [Macaca mulatta]MOW65137.1 immunoglobulin light chain junction region [Macaca mulatta]MOW65942.1 immunoglobulin light chain junction region [Macaca mulatta]